MQSELANHAARVDAAIQKSGQPFTQNERDALVSFDFNTGAGESVISRFAGDKKSLVSKMAEYNKLDKSDKEPSQGLINRRNAEIGLFSRPDAPQVGVTPAPGAAPSVSDQIAVAKFNEDQTAKSDEKGMAKAAAARTLETINRYLGPDGGANENLKSAVGFGEGFTTGLSQMTGGMVGNDPGTIAKQKELTLDLIEGSILEASKALKPVSNDEMKMLKANRPEITDPPEVWAWYMKRIKGVLGNPSNYKQEEKAAPTRSAADAIRATLPPRQ